MTFVGNVSWLVCKEICIPEEAALDLTLPVVDGPPAVNEQWRQAFDAASRRVPVNSKSFDARFAANGTEVTLFFFPTLNRIERGIGAQFFPYEKGLIKSSSAQVSQPRDGGFAFVLPPGWKLRDAEKRKAIDTIDGTLVLAPVNGETAQSFEVTLHRGDVPPAPLAGGERFAVVASDALCTARRLDPKSHAVRLPDPIDEGAGAGASRTCRAPMDGRTRLSLRRHHDIHRPCGCLAGVSRRGRRRGLGLPTAIAALCRDRSPMCSWLVGLNLSGVFQVAGSAQGAGQSLTNQPGVIGAFFTGILAVVVAAPCTAPFMGAAMGFAFTQSAAITIVVFIAMGVGLALPWVIFSFSPALIRLMPKPGAWMERFKQFLAFPMYGAAAWLVWVLSQQVAPEGLFRVLIGIVMLGFAAWALGVAQDRGAQGKSRVLSSLLFLLGAAAAIGILVPPFAERAAIAGTAETAKGDAYLRNPIPPRVSPVCATKAGRYSSI